jgi:Leucine-rich repeat (LRR) protein
LANSFTNALAYFRPSAADNEKKPFYNMKSQIKYIRSNAFRGLNDLVSLELSECDIESVDEGAFDGLDKLEYLRLDTNRLRTLSPSRSLPRNLR